MDEIRSFSAPHRMELDKTFSYNGSNVRMKKVNGTVFVCLTDMAKKFPNKTLSHIIYSKELTDYIKRLTEMQNCTSADLLQVTKGGSEEQGTWAHRKIALRVAQKLSPDFAIWVDDRVEELLTYGTISVQRHNLPADYPSALRELADKVEENQRLTLENKQKDNQIKKLQPKADFADAAFKAEGNVDIGQAAKILGLPFGRNTLFRKLREKGVLFGSRNEPKQRFVDAGYFVLTELPPIKRESHPDLIVMKCICTQKGLAYINTLFGGSLNNPTLAKIK
ncbi:phage antirepressor KilAC domain-containing protein [Prevotella sp. oral taxon 376]|uniref:phage antirepressor KilAC domain-containing protein n=1 Tax=Prevotella sp. oral taxon 376 TaxID=712466 RepID=UPI0011B1FC3C|nr:phage antirepressor KilAC domain-containing protein [Prevotella sp. oral taxon 376]